MKCDRIPKYCMSLNISFKKEMVCILYLFLYDKMGKMLDFTNVPNLVKERSLSRMIGLKMRSAIKKCIGSIPPSDV